MRRSSRNTSARGSKRKLKKRHRRKPRKPTTTAIVATAPPVTIVQHNRERRLRPDEIDLLKKTVAKGANDEEFMFFMTICRKHRVDPFTKQIYCILWPTENHTSHELVIIMGINGYRMLAARDHKDFAGTSKAQFTFVGSPGKTPAGRTIPETATVQAFRKGAEPSEAMVYWEEFAPANLKDKRADFWNRMPKHMLAKCAESHALRKAFPDLSDIYTEEEMSQRLQDLTPGGREISIDGVAPSGKVLTQGGSHEAGQAVGQAKLEELKQRAGGAAKGPGTGSGKKIDPMNVSNANPAVPKAQMPPKYFVTLDWTKPEDPILTGDVEGLVPRDKPPYGLLKGLDVTWGKDAFYHVGLSAVKDLRTICAENGYQLTEILPPAEKKSSGKQEAKPEKKGSAPASGAGAKPAATGPTLLTGTIHRTVLGTTKKGAPVMNVKIGNVWYSSYVNPIFQYMSNKDGHVIEFWIDKNKQIVGLKRIDDLHFDEDGRTPCVQNKDREAGGQRTLY